MVIFSYLLRSIFSSKCPANDYDTDETPKITLTSNELSIQNIFVDSSVIHSSEVSLPAQSALTKHCEHIW